MIFSLLISLAIAQDLPVVKTISSECLERELALWEKEKQRLPSPDEADLIIDMCVKQAYEQAKKNAKSK